MIGLFLLATFCGARECRSDEKKQERARLALESAHMLMSAQEGEAALKVVRRATALDPDLADAWAIKGVLLEAGGERRKALRALEKAEVLGVDDEELSQRASGLRGEVEEFQTSLRARPPETIFTESPILLPDNQWEVELGMVYSQADEGSSGLSAPAHRSQCSQNPKVYGFYSGFFLRN